MKNRRKQQIEQLASYEQLESLGITQDYDNEEFEEYTDEYINAYEHIDYVPEYW